MDCFVLGNNFANLFSQCASNANAHTRQKLLGTTETHCLLCNEKGLPDEYHLNLVCESLKSEREKYWRKFYKYPNILKLINKMMNLRDEHLQSI